jgi:hypothetical protein
MKRIIHFFWLILILFLVACHSNVPSPHSPESGLSTGELRRYTIAYCWQNPEGRQLRTSPEDKEVVVVIGSADGNQRAIARDRYNLSGQYLSDSVIYKLGCIESGNKIRYIGNALTWRPGSSEITFSEGSSPHLTDFDGRELIKDYTFGEVNIPAIFGSYQKYITEPRGVYWSPDGKKFATLARDLFIYNSLGDNIWMYDSTRDYYTRITKFNGVDFIANASWSKNGNMLAVEYKKQSGIGIAQFDKSSVRFLYFEVTSLTHPELSEYWPYAFTSWFQLLHGQENIDFNNYVSTTSFPVWINDDKQIIFAASDKSGQGTLFIVNSDGSNLKPFLPDVSGLIFMPTLSPDGTTLAFVRYPGWRDKSRAEIASVDLSAMVVKSLVVLTAPKNKETLLISGMSWSSDGKYLAFSSNHEGESDIYIMSADGSSWFNLTGDVTGNAVSPTWKP